MNINIEEDKVKELISAAILKELGEGQRDLLIAQAMTYLITEQKRGDSYNAKKFIPLHDAFNNAVSLSAGKIAREYVEQSTEIQDKIKALLVEAMEMLFVTNRAKIISSVEAAFLRGFEKEY